MEQIPFHKHLDICDRCRTNPFDLCPIGDSLLMAAPTAPVGQPECRKAHEEKCPHELQECIRGFREELKQARRDVLEEAAKICEDDGAGDIIDGFDCATSIRALMEKP